MERGKLYLELCAAALALGVMALTMNHMPRESEAAHAPFKTPTRNDDGRPVLDGRYAFRYCGTRGEAVMRPEGGWESFYAGSRWIGWWKAKGDMLEVGEAVRGPGQAGATDLPPAWYVWQVALEKGKWKGRTQSGGEFEILLPAIGEK